MNRIEIDINAGWDLILENNPGLAQPEYEAEPVLKVNLPHTWNATDTFVPSRGYFRGVGWYRKRFVIPSNLSHKRLLLNFLGFFQTAEFYLNGTKVHSSIDGFTGECFDITDHAKIGEENLIAVRVDNSHNPEILPGKDIPDYVLYGGIYREAFLVATNDAYILENGVAFTTPEVSRERALAQVSVQLGTLREASFTGTLTARLRDEAKRIICQVQQPVAFSQYASVQLTLPEIEQPLLWDVESPVLYSLEIELEDAGRPVDAITLKAGFRYFEFTSDEGFFLNGRHVLLKGVNRHQDFGGLGNAIPAELQRLDAEIIKRMGGNFVRLSHYPQHPAFLEACDELGILVFAEIASWQHVGGDEFTQNALAMMESMIIRDRNHSCIILWGLLNEGRNKALFDALNRKAKQCDATRPTIYAENKPEEGDALGTTTIPDVLGLNYKIPHLDDIRSRWQDKKLVSSEHTNADMTTRGDLQKELEYVQKLNHDLNEIYARKYLAGSTLWCMHDYATDYRPTWPHHKSGAIDHLRLEKEAFYMLQSHWLDQPVLHIMGHYNYQPGEAVTIWIITNCESVELLVNGKTLGSKRGGRLLAWDIEFQPGILKAIGIRGDRQVHSVLETTGAACRVALKTSNSRLFANGRCVALIDIEVLDKQDRRIWCEADCAVSINGPGEFCGMGGLPYIKIRAGKGRIAVRSQTETGEICVSAGVPGLLSDRVILNVSEPIPSKA
ncbi:DUF4982 domain-containing protein [candidate division KSB1 bacterium]|nr:DUF4982 domain-containing protein [candidate division KSB1 bacterium]